MPQQLADVLGVAGADLEQIAIVAGDVMELEHFGALRQRPRDAVVAGASSLCTATKASIRWSRTRGSTRAV